MLLSTDFSKRDRALFQTLQSGWAFTIGPIPNISYVYKNVFTVEALVHYISERVCGP